MREDFLFGFQYPAQMLRCGFWRRHLVYGVVASLPLLRWRGVRLPLLRQLGGGVLYSGSSGAQSGSRSMPQGKATGTCFFAATCFFAGIIQVLLDNHTINMI